MDAVTKLLEEQDFESVDEANAFLQELLAQGNIQRAPSMPLEEAQELVYQAWETRNRRQRERLVRQALEIYPDCADAYVLLAEDMAKTPQEASELYRKGVEAGERSLGPETFAEDAGSFWGLLETRPYMRARQGLARCLWSIGDLNAAVEHYREMLRLNPNDNQGVRYELLECLLDMNCLEEVEELLGRYEDEWSATWLFTGALVSFLREGDSPASREALEAALDENPYVAPYLLGQTKLPSRLPDYIGMGDRNEAIHYASTFSKACKKNPQALAWLEATQETPADPDDAEDADGASPSPVDQDETDLPLPLDLAPPVVEEEEFTEPSREDWAALYQAAIAFRDLAPWRWASDLDVFAVENPSDGQMGCCTVMGGGGMEFGLALMVGDEGLAVYRRLEAGELEPESFETVAMLRSLSVTFADRDYLGKPDLATIRSLKLRFRGRNAWPLFRSQRPGWLPWFLNQEEARFLTVALEQAHDVLPRVRDDELDLVNQADEELVLTRYFRDGRWQEEWRNLAAREPELAVPQPSDPARLQELSQKAKRPSGNWELGWFPVPAPIPAPSGRPYFPHFVMTVDRKSGAVLGFDMLGPSPEAAARQEAVIRVLERAPRLPRQLRVATNENRRILEPVAEPLGISVRVGPLPALEEAKDSLMDTLLGLDEDTF
jgi:tetratricopeptide (TPR) repeat protein